MAVDVASGVCFFAGCHVDREQGVITGPTEQEWLEQGAMNMVGPLGMASVPISRGTTLFAKGTNRIVNYLTDATKNLARHGDELRNLTRITRSVLEQATSSFRSTSFWVAGERYLLSKDNLQFILSRHHPEYFGAAGTKIQMHGLNSAFAANMSIDDVVSAVDRVLMEGYQNRTPVRNGFQIVHQIDGNWYELIVDTRLGHIVHFTPLAEWR